LSRVARTRMASGWWTTGRSSDVHLYKKVCIFINCLKKTSGMDQLTSIDTATTQHSAASAHVGCRRGGGRLSRRNLVQVYTECLVCSASMHESLRFDKSTMPTVSKIGPTHSQVGPCERKKGMHARRPQRCVRHDTSRMSTPTTYGMLAARRSTSRVYLRTRRWCPTRRCLLHGLRHLKLTVRRDTNS
jgi:hypothetical protein